jgi:hypothetical protein
MIESIQAFIFFSDHIQGRTYIESGGKGVCVEAVTLVTPST